jgi:hypothetical protein
MSVSGTIIVAGKILTSDAGWNFWFMIAFTLYGRITPIAIIRSIWISSDMLFDVLTSTSFVDKRDLTTLTVAS